MKYFIILLTLFFSVSVFATEWKQMDSDEGNYDYLNYQYGKPSIETIKNDKSRGRIIDRLIYQGDGTIVICLIYSDNFRPVKTECYEEIIY